MTPYRGQVELGVRLCHDTLDLLDHPHLLVVLERLQRHCHKQRTSVGWLCVRLLRQDIEVMMRWWWLREQTLETQATNTAHKMVVKNVRAPTARE